MQTALPKLAPASSPNCLTLSKLKLPYLSPSSFAPSQDSSDAAACVPQPRCAAWPGECAGPARCCAKPLGEGSGPKFEIPSQQQRQPADHELLMPLGQGILWKTAQQASYVELILQDIKYDLSIIIQHTWTRESHFQQLVAICDDDAPRKNVRLHLVVEQEQQLALPNTIRSRSMKFTAAASFGPHHKAMVGGSHALLLHELLVVCSGSPWQSGQLSIRGSMRSNTLCA